MFTYFSSKFYVAGTFILDEIVKKLCDTQPGVDDQHLDQNQSNFYHILSLDISNFLQTFNTP